MEPIKLLIADDHPVVRAGLAAMLAEESDLCVVGDAATGLEAVKRAKECRPDIILMDLRMPELDGVEAMRIIAKEDPEIKFVVLTTYDSDDYIFKGIEAGARAFLLKDSPPEDLIKAIRAVYCGESLLQSAVTGKLLDRFIKLSHQSQDPDALTDRELEVLRLMAKGIPNKTIASELFLSESTVKGRIGTIFRKLGVDDRTKAVAEALHRGIIEL